VVVQAVVLGSANLAAPQVVARTRANLVSGPPKLASSPAQPPTQQARPPVANEDAASRPTTFDTNVPIMQS
jgi:hypothetical protein